MKHKAQGAMEYLMSYGWAILVVMIVGVAMWRLGIFDLGTSTATSTGFQALKPLLPTCKISSTVHLGGLGPPGFGGFRCMFVNGAGEQIKITYLDFSIDGEKCAWNYIISDDDISTNPWNQFYVTNHDGATYCDGSGDLCTADDGLMVPKGSNKMVIKAMSLPIANMGADDPCVEIMNGATEREFEVDIDMTYEINVGGKVVEKHSIGTIRVSGS